ncbi:ABC transporter permease [Halorubrum vacuolatum]|uniref:Nucleoside ABC transporter membrane protein n=1 Tax=Halorubrum vacuolatum TaxID=63740 RepID=A0A238VLM0_HALVU|nr:ABC transporter permease [Halorubrum vacuolatum]SNR35126.1 nucleoside ABC transporter membrane protein [Halorubrum vacuolatum]
MNRPTVTRRQGLAIGAILFGLLLVGFVIDGGRALLGDVAGVISASYFAAVFRFTVPIAFAAMGGIFAEKTGVINIGLEGLLIIGAFSAVAALWGLSATPVGANIWVAFLLAVLASTLVALLFATVCIDFKADQIIAGLAIWLIALGFAPFASIIIWDRTNSPSVGTFPVWEVPVLADLPTVGPLFSATLPVFLLVLAVPFSWYLLNRTTFGKWVEASGEDPKSLDTAGVDVRRIRYAGVLLSGVYCGIGGAGLALNTGQFVGSGDTMVDGRGWIGLTAYLIGNYNPIGAFLASFLFAALDALQLQLQQIAGFEVSSTLVGIIPYVAVVIVLTFVGRTRMPSAAGEHYESDE